jgi:menaquinone-9 beta-reductase
VRLPARVDVLVAGLGPAGAATAIRLARAGLRVLAVDRARFPRDKPCSEYLSPETLRQLHLLGALDRLTGAGAPLAGVTVHGPGGARLTGRFASAGVAPFRPLGLSVARRVLDHALVEEARAAGAMVAEATTVTGLLHDAGGVAGAVARRDGRLAEIRARLVVGADGLRSVTARHLGGRRRGAPARMAFVAHVAGVAGLGDTAEMHVGQDGYAGLNAIGGGLANVALVVPAARAAAARGAVPAFWHAALDRFPGVRGRVPAGGVTGPVRVTGPFAVRARRVTAGGALLVGDAADFFDPFTGEGICTALRGAALATDTALEALALPGPVSAARLAGYARRRRRAFAGKWAVERLIGYGMLAPALFDRAVRRLEQRGLAHTLVGVTGQFVPAGQVLRPAFLAAMIL